MKSEAFFLLPSSSQLTLPYPRTIPFPSHPFLLVSTHNTTHTLFSLSHRTPFPAKHLPIPFHHFLSPLSFLSPPPLLLSHAAYSPSVFPPFEGQPGVCAHMAKRSNTIKEARRKLHCFFLKKRTTRAPVAERKENAHKICTAEMLFSSWVEGAEGRVSLVRSQRVFHLCFLFVCFFFSIVLRRRSVILFFSSSSSSFVLLLR